MVWLRSMNREGRVPWSRVSGAGLPPFCPAAAPLRLAKRSFQVDPRHRADPRDGLAHLVVRGRGAGRDPDDPGATQPTGGNRFGFGSDELMPDGSGHHVYRVRILDVVDGHGVLLYQRGQMTGVARVVST